MPKIYLRAHVLYRLHDYLYHYRYRPGAITQDRSLRRANDFARNANEALDNCNGGPLDQFWFLMFHDAFQNVLNLSAEVDAGCFVEARNIMRSLYRRYQSITAAIPSPIPSEELAHFHRQLYKGRIIFCAKRTLKRWPWLYHGLAYMRQKTHAGQVGDSINGMHLPEEELSQGKD